MRLFIFSLVVLTVGVFVLEPIFVSAEGFGRVRFPSCQDIKERKTKFFSYNTTNSVTPRAYGLFFRNKLALLQNIPQEKCTPPLKDAANTDKIKEYRACVSRNDVIERRKLNEYVTEKINIKFGPKRKTNKNRDIVDITVVHKEYNRGQAVTRTCFDIPKALCPIVAVNYDTTRNGRKYVGKPEIYCASPDGQGIMSRSVKTNKKDRLVRLGENCVGPACARKGRHIDAKNKYLHVTKEKRNGAFTKRKGAFTKRYQGPIGGRPDRVAQSQFKRQQAINKRKSQSVGQADGFIKQLQNAFQQRSQQKAQDAARKRKEEQERRKREDALYKARLRLPECHPGHPYYKYNQEKCKKGADTKPIVESRGAAPRKSTARRTTTAGQGVIIKNTNTNSNSNTLSGISAQKCNNRKPKAIIVAQPKAVKSGEETTVKWASVCTASCKVTAQEVGSESQEPILTELGRKGEVTGKLYNNTRFDLSCKDFNDKPSTTSTVTVKLKS